MADIFISYAREDQPFVLKMVAALEAEGFSVWWDHTIPPGKSWDTFIARGIKEAKAAFVIWSRNSIDSEWVKEEASVSRSTGKYLPVQIDDSPPPLGFSRIQAANLAGWGGDATNAQWRMLLRETRNLVSGDLPSGTSTPALSGAEETMRTRLSPGQTWRDAIAGVPMAACPEMVTIPAGKFFMGSPESEEARDNREGPQHEVSIDYLFALGRHTVTFEEWDAAIAAGAKLETPSDNNWGRGRRPVINVSWEDAREYIDWLNTRLGLKRRNDAYRLPSEAEWEYACRAGSASPFTFGATISSTQANYNGHQTYGAGAKGQYREMTLPVGSFAANQFGLHDMHGNVREWCEDVWNENYQGAPDDGSPWVRGNHSLRIARGGSWFSEPKCLRSADRFADMPSARSRYLGFRLARTLSAAG